MNVPITFRRPDYSQPQEGYLVTFQSHEKENRAVAVVDMEHRTFGTFEIDICRLDEPPTNEQLNTICLALEAGYTITRRQI